VSGSGVGTDTLRSVEYVSGSNFADTFSAIGFSGTSANAGSNGAANEFEGRGGNDIIKGNGNTRVSYANATASVTVDIQAGTATGDSSVGTDSFTGVTAVRGSAFDDALFGSNNPGPNLEVFEGRAGDDFIDGRGGFDRAAYDMGTTGGVTINLAAGIVTGNASIGTDTLRSIESIRGTNSADSYDATGFTTSSTTAASPPGFVNALGAASNEFEGLGGNDTIIGNGNTRIAFYNATAGVTVDLQAGTASGDTSVGSDTFTGVNAVYGSNFDDTIIGDANQNFVEGRAGNDFIDGGGNFDSVSYSNSPNGVAVNLSTGTAADGWGGTDTLANFEFVSGSAFADTIIGSVNGNETFEGRGGNDLIDGGGHVNGNPFGDLVQYTGAATSGITVDLDAGTATDGLGGTDTLINIDSVNASRFNDIVIGNANNNLLRGFDGNDTIHGGDGNDRIEGDQSFNPSLLGNDVLYGDAGQDTILGNAGDDRLDGGADSDVLIGGTGADTFVYTTTADGLDHISDFDGHGGQTDVIEFNHLAFGNGLGAGGLNTGTLDASHFIADNIGPTDVVQVFWYNTDDHTLYYDADGNGAGSAIAIAVLDNGFVLNHTDLVLV